MPAKYSAQVLFANGIAAQNVRVRLYDRDSPGAQDDDLTITPGLSDTQGNFFLEYDPTRYKDAVQVVVTAPRNPPFDWTLETFTRLEFDRTDVYHPYLQFTYDLDGTTHTFQADLKSGFSKYLLPEIFPLRFTPSVHGWKFLNSFKGFFLPFALPAIPGLGNPGSVYGLCGGMAAGALDLFLNNRPVPTTDVVPQNGSSIQRFLYKRQIDSMGSLGETIRRFHEWMGLPDESIHGLRKLTLDEFENKIRPKLNKFTPVPMGMLYVKWADSGELWLNHQVLALRYEFSAPNHYRLFIYDPNFPQRDDIYIDAEKVDVGGAAGLRVVQRMGETGQKKLFGFFAIKYRPNSPPEFS